MVDKIYIWETDDCKRSWGEITPPENTRYRLPPKEYTSYADVFQEKVQAYHEGYNSGHETGHAKAEFEYRMKNSSQNANHTLAYTALIIIIIFLL